MASEKALRWAQAWHTQGTARSGVSCGRVVGDKFRLVGRASDMQEFFSSGILNLTFFSKYTDFKENTAF